ncbi:MAG: hypothetical protein EPO62_06435 [Candidatus Nitrosotenuis sp.]|nr:MAG: hypothetical protein EPO62_06435 [Candidatus Nitrosotenuis sp.]
MNYFFQCITIGSIWIIVFTISAVLLASVIITPVYATKTIEVTKDVDVRKDLMSKTLTDLTIYKKIFPDLINDIKLDPTNKNQAKFIVGASGITREADVKSTISSDGSFTVDIVSGELKGSKIVTTLKERYGFDGTPNGGTTVKTKLILEYGFLVSLVMPDDSTIENNVGDGFYKVGQYVKVQYPQKKQQLVNVDYKKNTTPKLEAAKKLDPQKEAKKIQLTTQTKPIQKETAKILDFEKEAVKPQPTVPKIQSIQKISEQAKVETVKPTQKQPSFIALDPLPSTAKIGDVIVFSGRLHLLDANPEGATIYIKDEDPFGADDFMAGGIVDSSGRFNISWTVKNMDIDSVADIYAVFEGSDIHPRLTTCSVDCTNTIQLATLR